MRIAECCTFQYCIFTAQDKTHKNVFSLMTVITFKTSLTPHFTTWSTFKKRVFLMTPLHRQTSSFASVNTQQRRKLRHSFQAQICLKTGVLQWWSSSWDNNHQWFQYICANSYQLLIWTQIPAHPSTICWLCLLTIQYKSLLLFLADPELFFNYSYWPAYYFQWNLIS